VVVVVVVEEEEKGGGGGGGWGVCGWGGGRRSHCQLAISCRQLAVSCACVRARGLLSEPTCAREGAINVLSRSRTLVSRLPSLFSLFSRSSLALLSAHSSPSSPARALSSLLLLSPLSFLFSLPRSMSCTCSDSLPTCVPLFLSYSFPINHIYLYILFIGIKYAV